MILRPKRCPFCAHPEVTIIEGTTSRWRVAQCSNCGAQCGEIRYNPAHDMPEEDAKERAIQEWNRRA